MKRYYINYYDVLEKLSTEDRQQVINELSDLKRVEQLGSCQAWILYTSQYIILQSYSTLVACINYSGECFYSGYYSNTTSQQVSRFARLMGLTFEDFKKSV